MNSLGLTTGFCRRSIRYSAEIGDDIVKRSNSSRGGEHAISFMPDGRHLQENVIVRRMKALHVSQKIAPALEAVRALRLSAGTGVESRVHGVNVVGTLEVNHIALPIPRRPGIPIGAFEIRRWF